VVEQMTENHCVVSPILTLGTDMWEVYILQSIKFGRYYIGYSQNAGFRLENYHNAGLCKFTKAYCSYKNIKIEKYNTKTEV
jgi:predicted GIY-YIG superfamily endonuclease